MTPDLGQGGAQAIEDGVVLGDVLRPDADPIAALREYELRRMPIAYDILRRARRHYRLAQFENPLLCALRNQTVRILPRRSRVSSASADRNGSRPARRRRAGARRHDVDERRRTSAYHCERALEFVVHRLHIRDRPGGPDAERASERRKVDWRDRRAAHRRTDARQTTGAPSRFWPHARQCSDTGGCCASPSTAARGTAPRPIARQVCRGDRRQAARSRRAGHRQAPTRRRWTRPARSRAHHRRASRDADRNARSARAAAPSRQASRVRASSASSRKLLAEEGGGCLRRHGPVAEGARRLLAPRLSRRRRTLRETRCAGLRGGIVDRTHIEKRGQGGVACPVTCRSAG